MANVPGRDPREPGPSCSASGVAQTLEDIDLLDSSSIPSKSPLGSYDVSELKDAVQRLTSLEARVAVNKFVNGQDPTAFFEMLAREKVGTDATPSEIKAFMDKASIKIELISKDDPEPEVVSRIDMGGLGFPMNHRLAEPSPEQQLPTTGNDHGEQPPNGPFVYEPLEPGQIRLLRLGPTLEKGVPNLQITHHPLRTAPEFSALSYAWGSADLCKEARCNGRIKYITESLYCALGRVFQWRDDVYLWADGLCINQEDIAERNEQVKLMGEIYSRAQRTVAYLGEAPVDDGTLSATNTLAVEMDQIPFALMQCLTRIWKKAGPEDRKSDEEWEMLNVPGLDFSDPDDQEGVTPSLVKWLSILTLCWMPWFTRAWVVQEVALAKELLVFYGSAVNSLDCLGGFWELSEGRDLPPVLRYGMIADLKDRIGKASLLGVFMELRAARERELDDKKGRGTSKGGQGVEGDGEGGREVDHENSFILPDRGKQSRTLLGLLKQTRQAGATDPRDKVYSLMALATDAPSLGIVPDYAPENTTARVYRHIATTYIRAGHALDVLYQAGLPRSKHVGDTPSWVPDWSTQYRRPLNENLYSCMKDTVSVITLHSDPGRNELIAQGGIIDSLIMPGLRVNFEQVDMATAMRTGSAGREWFSPFSEMGVPADHLPHAHHGWNAALEILHSAETAAVLFRLPGVYPETGEALRYAVWRTVTAGMGWYENREDGGGGQGRVQDDKAAYEAYLRAVPRVIPGRLPPFNMEILREIWSVCSAVMRSSQGYFFGVTACGRMGLFPNDVRMGDLIALVSGSRTPFVLRPAEGVSSSRSVREKKFVLVGNCYVHGVMNGEGLRPCRDRGQVAPRDSEERPYRVKLRPWVEMLGGMAKPRMYFDPDVQSDVKWEDLCIT